MAIQETLAETVFEKGNLVYGCALYNFDSHINQGIRPGVAVGSESPGCSENICFSPLADRPLQGRYQQAMHYGPGAYWKRVKRNNIGIVVSRPKLMELLPVQLRAVGEFFTCPDIHPGIRERYQFDPINNTVFGIPIDFSFTGSGFADEIRLFTPTPMHTAIKPELWTGLVVEEFNLHTLPVFVKSVDECPNIPVFSPETLLFIPDLKEHLQSIYKSGAHF